MKQFLKMALALLIVAMVFGACELEFDNGGGTGDSGVDFKDYTGTERAIAFKNSNTNSVVIFASELKAENLLGGVKAGVTSGISKSNNTAWFNKTQAFPVVIITEKQYNENKKDLKKIEAPLTKLYIFYNAQGENKAIYDINGNLGGNEYYIELTMPVSGTWNVEMRDGGITGPAVGYAQAGMMHTKLFVMPDINFNLFPVFHRWNPYMEVLDIVYPKDDEGYALGFFFALGEGSGMSNFRFNMKELLDAIKAEPPQVGAAYLNITSNVSNTMIHMLNGSGQPIRNPLGVSAFAGTKTFKIDMGEIQPNSGNFNPSVSIAGYKIGMDSRENPITVLMDADDPDYGTARVNVKNGKIYQVTVNGTVSSPGSIKAELDMRTTGTSSPVTDFVWNEQIN